jgi:hypothetical protein
MKGKLPTSEGLGTDGTKKAVFLDALGRLASISRACQIARIPRRTVYNWRSQDEGFATAWEKAIELGTDALEDEAVRRAFQGVLKPVYQQGRRVGSIREFSDALLIALLKARRPKKYRDNIKIDANVTGGILCIGAPTTAEVWKNKYGSMRGPGG